jgi:hypothetical protein
MYCRTRELRESYEDHKQVRHSVQAKCELSFKMLHEAVHIANTVL